MSEKERVIEAIGKVKQARAALLLAASELRQALEALYHREAA